MTENSSQKTYGLFSTAPGRSLMNRLSARDIDHLAFPAAEIVETKLTPAESDIFTELDEYQWLIFGETVSVEIFFKHLSENEIDFYELDNLRIGVLGELTADRLRFEQIHSDLIFTSKEDPAEMIKKFIADEGEIKNSRFLLLRGRAREAEIENALTNASLNFHTLELFEAKPVKNEESAKLKALLRGGAVDEFLLTCTEDLIALEMYHAETGISNLPEELSLCGTDENLVRYLREKGYRAKIFSLSA